MLRCTFCRIAAGEIPTQKEYEDERVLAFRDIQPKAPIHILIIPKAHRAGMMDLSEGDETLMGELIHAAQQLARSLGVTNSGFRIVINTGQDAGQAVAHLHVHLLAGRKMGWPPG